MKLLPLFTAAISLAFTSSALGQAAVGDQLPDLLGFTQAPPSAPLANLTEFDFNAREGEVIVAVYHASW